MNFKYSVLKWSALAIPVLGASHCSGRGGGRSPSPSADMSDWLSGLLTANLPAGTLETMHHLPVVGWFV